MTTDWPAFHTEPLYLVSHGDDGLPRNIMLPPGTFEEDMELLVELGIMTRVEETV